MRAGLAAVAGLTAIALTGAVQAGVLVTYDTAKVGDKPSAVADYQLPGSSLSDYDIPKSHLEAGTPSGGLSASGGAPEFDLSGLRSELREETSQLLTKLDATERDDGSIVIALPGDVLFDFDKFDIRADARPVLDQLVTVLVNYASPKVEISGHTDSKGSDEYNQVLSENRAESVRTYLAEHGVEPDDLTIIGKGESEPISPNEKADGSDDPDGRQANRRVEFVITPPSVED